MRKFVEPKIEILNLEEEDILSNSSDDSGEGVLPDEDDGLGWG